MFPRHSFFLRAVVSARHPFIKSFINRTFNTGQQYLKAFPEKTSKIIRPAAPKKFFSALSHCSQKQDYVSDESFIVDLAFQINERIQVSVMSSQFSIETNRLFNEGSDLISSIGYRHFHLLRDEEIDAHLAATNTTFGGIRQQVLEFSPTIVEFERTSESAIIINEQCNAVYLANAGNFKKIPFPIQLAREEIHFLQNAPRDEYGCFLKTADNTKRLEEIERKIKTVIGDPQDLSQEEKLKRLLIYLTGTLIRVMNFEDYKYFGPQKRFKSQRLYPPGVNQSLYLRSIQEVGNMVLTGELPFGIEVINPVMHDLFKDTMIKDLFKHFNVGAQTKALQAPTSTLRIG